VASGCSGLGSTPAGVRHREGRVWRSGDNGELAVEMELGGGGTAGSDERTGRWERLGWSEARPGCPFIGSGGWRRQLGRAGGNGNWHLQWSHYRSEGGGRKCGRVNGGGGGNEGPDRLG
jgi:hypothetical protein